MAEGLNGEELLQLLFRGFTREELQRLARSAEALHQAAAKAANDGDHRYDPLGESVEWIGRATQSLLNDPPQQA